MNMFEVIDLFAGAGGVTTGIEQAEVGGLKIARVICAINHDEVAIESHWRNHPHVKHFVEDIKTFDVKRLPKIYDPLVKKFLWASLECTNHSNAKGGLSRDADSRTLAKHLYRYIEEFNPDYIGIENVREFRDWGPLTQKRGKNGKLMSQTKGKHKGEPVLIPNKTKKGIDYKKWIKAVCGMGYHFEEKILNAADFGAHTSRRRLFILFAKEGLPVAWPEPTHDKFGKNGLLKWKPVKECLDFSDKGENIFGRKKDLCENTYKRIYAGLIKFIANGDESFIEQYNGNGDDQRIFGPNDTCNTITTANRFGLVQPEFIQQRNNGDPKSKVCSIDNPARTITATGGNLELVQTEFLLNYHHSSDANSTENPSPTITTHDKLGIVSTEHFIDMQHGSGKQNESVDEPCGAILPVIKKNLITVEHFLDQQFGESKPADINQPCAALTANPKYNLVSAFLYNPQFKSKGGSIDDPCFTLIGKMGKRPPSLVQAYLADMQFNNIGTSVDNPSPTIFAVRRYPYLIQLETGQLAIEVYKSDSEYMKKIKIFMAAYGIIAIYMRMLRIPELIKITGLPEDYILEGTQSDQKKFIGNAVPPALPKAIFEALYEANNKEEMSIAV